MIIALCLLLTATLLFYVFYIERQVESAQEKTRVTYLEERKEAVYDNLRDLNFEYRAGKFPQSDYLAMRTALEDEAAQILAEIDRLEGSAVASARAAPKGVRR